MIQKPYFWDGYGMTANTIAQTSTKVDMTSLFLGLVGSLPPDEQNDFVQNLWHPKIFDTPRDFVQPSHLPRRSHYKTKTFRRCGRTRKKGKLLVHLNWLWWSGHFGLSGFYFRQDIFLSLEVCHLTQWHSTESTTVVTIHCGLWWRRRVFTVERCVLLSLEKSLDLISLWSILVD